MTSVTSVTWIVHLTMPKQKFFILPRTNGPNITYNQLLYRLSTFYVCKRHGTCDKYLA